MTTLVPTFEHLPYNLLRRIGQSLDHSEASQSTLHSLVLTCHRFYHLYLPLLWASPYLDSDRRIHRFSSLISDRPLYSALLTDVTQDTRHPRMHLHTLSFSALPTRWFTITNSTIATMLPALPGLRHVDVALCGALNDQFLAMLTVHAPKLQTLNLSYIE